MNINEYKKYLHSIHGTLDDDPGTKQLSARLRKEAYPSDMDEYKPVKKEDRSTLEPTTAAGDTLRPDSKSAEKGEKVKMKEGAADASAAGGKKPKKVVVEDEFEEGAADASAAGPSRKKKVVAEEAVLQYFNNYFGDELTENTSDEDIMEAVYDLIELCDAVCDAIGLKSKKNLTVDEAFPRFSDNLSHAKPAGPTSLRGRSNQDTERLVQRKVFGDKEYLKPSPEQLKKAIEKAKDNSPILQTGQGTNTRTVRPSDIRGKARAKRIRRMGK